MKFKSGSTFILQNKGYKIKEVKVTSKRIIERKDTLIYSVSGFQMPQDRTIADVLKKMPGIEVLPSGQIKFEDKAISKLYIEGMDLMGNRYSLATNNLSNKVVKEVQVLRNHQAISVLRGKSFSEQAALNLVLTDDVRYTFSGSADIGIGYSGNDELVWDARLVGLFFGNGNRICLSTKRIISAKMSVMKFACKAEMIMSRISLSSLYCLCHPYPYGE